MGRTPHRCHICGHISNDVSNMMVHLGSSLANHGMGHYVCQVAGCHDVTYRIGRNDNHSHPTAHQASWVVDQNRRTALVTAAQNCRIQPAVAPPGPGPAATATANAALPGAPAAAQAVAGPGPGPGALHAAGNAVPGPAPPAANNAAPVAPIPGLVATGPTLAGVQGQNIPSGPGQGHANPPGAGHGQADQLNNDDDDDEDQDAEHEQDGQPVVNEEDATVEEQEEDQEQDNETMDIDEDDNGSEQDAEYEQDDQPDANIDDNAVEEQEDQEQEDQEQDEQSTGTNSPAPLALVLGPTVSTTPIAASAQGQTNPPGTGFDADNAGTEQQRVLRVHNHDITWVLGGYPDSTESTLFDDQYRVTMADRARERYRDQH